MAQWLLITCGYPFSGKTTLARAVTAHLGLTRVSVDDQHDRLDVDMDARSISERDWLRAYRSAIDQTRLALARGESVIFDSVGHTRRNRYRLRRVAAQASAQSLVIYLAVSELEARARLRRNRANPVRVQVPSEGFAEIVAAFEPPGDDEDQIRFDPEDDLNQWIKERLAPVLAGQESRVWPG